MEGKTNIGCVTTWKLKIELPIPRTGKFKANNISEKIEVKSHNWGTVSIQIYQKQFNLTKKKFIIRLLKQTLKSKLKVCISRRHWM